MREKLFYLTTDSCCQWTFYVYSVCTIERSILTNNYRKFLLCWIFFSLDICSGYWLLFLLIFLRVIILLTTSCIERAWTTQWLVISDISILTLSNEQTHTHTHIHLGQSGEPARLQLQIDKHSMISIKYNIHGIYSFIFETTKTINSIWKWKNTHT